MARRLAVLVLAAGLLAGCAGSSGSGTAAGDASGEQGASRQVTILVAAAASLKNAFEQQLIPMFEEQHPGVEVEGIYDSSGRLQTQIEEGLEADVFLSAAMKQMDALDQEGLLVPGTRVSLLENRIVLIVPAGGEEGFREFGDIA
ncbi:MAG: molybdate ABC transporter substrate-binding protein, partial [Lachnospiraceae bacterium]|nr:molybdate ABC transporter substrate-binding protein [Lachnospiraceae bacterium]